MKTYTIEEMPNHRVAFTFGLIVYRARKNKNLTQPALAELTGLSAAMISKIENGLANPTLETMTCLCEHLNIEIKFEHDETEQ